MDTDSILPPVPNAKPVLSAVEREVPIHDSNQLLSTQVPQPLGFSSEQNAVHPKGASCLEVV